MTLWLDLAAIAVVAGPPLVFGSAWLAARFTAWLAFVVVALTVVGALTSFGRLGRCPSCDGGVAYIPIVKDPSFCPSCGAKLR